MIDETRQKVTSNQRRRVMRSQKQWRDLITKFERGELGVRQFCEQHDLTSSSFHLWRKRLREEKQPAPRFVALSVPAGEREDWDVELSLGPSMTLRLRHS